MVVGAAASLAVVSVGVEASIGFIANEIKDEALSQATGGLSDVVDVTKAGTKLLKNGIEFATKKSVSNINNVAKSVTKNFDGLEDVGKISPTEVKFSQNSIKSTFSDGRSVSDLTKGLKDGTINPNDIPAIRITSKDGQIFSLDNRRLKAFQDAGVDVNFKKVDFNTLPKRELNKFTTTNGGNSIRVRGQ